MSYSQNIADITYNKSDIPLDVRCRDLYVDRDFYLNGIIPNMGINAVLLSDIIIDSNDDVLDISSIVPAKGGYADNLTISGGFITIPTPGIFYISALIHYEHNFNVIDQYVTVQFRNGANVLCESTIFYPSNANDIITIPINTVCQLPAGAIIGLHIQTNFLGGTDQLVKEDSTFTCQRLR